MHKLNKTLLATGLSCLALGGVAIAQQSATTTQPAQPAQATQSPSVGAALTGNDLPGPIDSIQDLQDSGKILFKVADTNNDGRISQKEATDAGNLMVGGIFFRADQNGDGTLSKEEADAAREALFRQQPLLRFVVQKGKMGVQQQGNNPTAETAKNTIQSLTNMIDANHDNQLQASELRQAVQMAVQGLYAAADTDHDTQLSPSEINASIAGIGKMAARTAFHTADADNNGQVSKDEFTKAITEPANIVFTIFDANNDGQISPQELQTAEQIIAAQLRNLRVPEPSNSLGNMLQTGQTPGQAGRVPSLRTPRESDNQVRPTGSTTQPPQ